MRQNLEYNSNDKELKSISREMQKTVRWERGIPNKKSFIWTVEIRCFDLTNKFWLLKSPPILFFSKFEVY